MSRVRAVRDTGEVVGEYNSESEAREACRGLAGMNCPVRYEEVQVKRLGPPLGPAAPVTPPRAATSETAADVRGDHDENSAAWSAVEKSYPRIVRELREGRTVRIRLQGKRLTFPKK